jgi:hypothetical protein
MNPPSHSPALKRGIPRTEPSSTARVNLPDEGTAGLVQEIRNAVLPNKKRVSSTRAGKGGICASYHETLRQTIRMSGGKPIVYNRIDIIADQQEVSP